MLIEIDLPFSSLVLRVCVCVCVCRVDPTEARPPCRFGESSCQYCVICKCEEFSGGDVGGAEPCSI